MTLSLPFGLGSGIGVSSAMDNTYHQFDPQGRWQANSADPSADLSIYPRSQALSMQGRFGTYGLNAADIVRGASEALIEQNTFYLQIKLALGQKNQELAGLKEASVNQKKELDELKAKYETLEKAHRTAIEVFAAEYHDLKARSGSGKRHTLSFVGIAPWPPLLLQEEKPGVVYWVKEFYLRAPAAQQKGETDGNVTTIAVKNNIGCPRKSTVTEEDELGIQGGTHKHIYLEKEDGTLISVPDLRALSQKACAVWEDLLNEGHAPKTWGKILSVAWEYYARSVLNEPGLEFLRLCEDGQWKLREWSQLNYSGWAKRRGIREVRVKKEATGNSNSSIDGKDLIRMDPNDSEEPEDIDTERSLADPDDTADPGPGTSEGALLEARPAETPWPPATTLVKSVVVNPLSRSMRGATNPVPPPVVNANAVVNTTVNRNEVVPDLETTTVMLPSHTDLIGATPTGSEDTEAALVGDTPPPAPRIGATPTGSEDAEATLVGDAPPPAPRTEATPTSSEDTEAASVGDTPPPARQLPRPRLVFKLPNTANVVRTKGNLSHNPPPPAPGPASDPRPSTQQLGTMPTNAAPRNLRLEQAQAVLVKKRKPEDKLPGVSNKRLKSSPAMLATPSDKNSIRNICMQQWNERQPGGQGLAADFDLYFKTLTEADKEARFHMYNVSHLHVAPQAFKKEMCTVRGANRKAKAASKSTATTMPAN